MTTNFALSLSFEGIELLHRVPRGWRRVGTADVTSETLDADLSKLREKALELAPDGLRTKLIIPLDQIKYTAIDSTQTTQDDIHDVLEGATPYALDDLIIDCERFGGRTHIAAVAIETLKEAETFAAAHGFQPVAFVAVPEPFTFQKEVFFGPTSVMPQIMGTDAEVTRDDLPVMVVGTRIKSRLLIFDLPQEVEEEVYKDDLAALLSGHADRNVKTEAVEAPAQTTAEKQPQNTAESKENPFTEGATTRVAAPVPRPIWIDLVPVEYHPPLVSADIDTPTTTITTDFVLIPEDPAFATHLIFDTVIPETHPSPFPKVKAPLVAIAGAVSDGAPSIVSVATPVANRTPLPTNARPSKTPLIAAAVAGAVVITAALLWSQQETSDVAMVPETPMLGLAEEQLAQEATPVTVAPEVPAPGVSDLQEVGPEPALIELTDFGTAMTDGGALPVFAPEAPGPTQPSPQTPIAALADDLPRAVRPPPPAPPAPETAQASVSTPVLRGTVLSPAEAERIYQATGVWQRSPRFFDVPSGAIAFGFNPPELNVPPDRVVQPDGLTREGLGTDLSFIAPADPPAPGVVFQRGADGFILATPDGTLTPEGALVFAGLPDLTITPRPELSQEDLDRMALLGPAPEGVVIVAGRPDVVPPLRPAEAELPETIEADDATAEPPLAAQRTPGSVGLAALELQNTGAVGLDTSTVEDDADDDLRPLLRPQGLSSVIDPDTPDITAIIAGLDIDDATLRFDNSTSLAVALSARPNPRPAGFSNAVASARAQLETPPAVSAAPAPVIAAAPVAPQNFGTVPGDVARAATQEDAIRLREINLIGVYGRPNARRALVRLSNGRYVRVEVGSALDGGQVTAIDDTALNYVKRGRTYAIDLPSG